MSGPFEPSGRVPLRLLRGLIAGSPIRIEWPVRLPLSWDQMRHSPQLDLLILDWIASHVPPGNRARAH